MLKLVLLTGLATLVFARISPDGTCGGRDGYSCLGSYSGDCCSQYNWCGASPAYCNDGCQSQYGSCDSHSPSSEEDDSQGHLKPSHDGQCGRDNGHTCIGYDDDATCCSQWGWSGSLKEYCGSGCQSDFGDCSLGSPSRAHVSVSKLASVPKLSSVNRQSNIPRSASARVHSYRRHSASLVSTSLSAESRASRTYVSAMASSTKNFASSIVLGAEQGSDSDANPTSVSTLDTMQSLAANLDPSDFESDDPPAPSEVPVPTCFLQVSDADNDARSGQYISVQSIDGGRSLFFTSNRSAAAIFELGSDKHLVYQGTALYGSSRVGSYVNVGTDGLTAPIALECSASGSGSTQALSCNTYRGGDSFRDRGDRLYLTRGTDLPDNHLSLNIVCS